MRSFLAVLGLLLALAVSPAQADVPAPVWKDYRHAIVDSMRPRSGEVVTDLVRLTRSDPRVRWKIIGGKSYVLLATARRNPLGEVSPLRLSSSKWAFVPGQMRDRCVRAGCATMGPSGLDLTVKQFLGLPPDADYSQITTFWARPRAIFRPCRQPDVRATTCPRRAQGLLPTVDGVAVRTFLRDQAAYAWRMPAHLNVATAVSCASAWPEPPDCYGFPWTRLGYAYDWGPRRSEVGLTEFVVAQGATVHLGRVRSQQDFLGPAM